MTDTLRNTNGCVLERAGVSLTSRVKERMTDIKIIRLVTNKKPVVDNIIITSFNIMTPPCTMYE